MSKLTVLEGFAGIGAVHKALTNLKVLFEVVEIIEFDKNAVKSYNAVHGTNFEPQDITTWCRELKVDYAHFSPPCQAFSYAGLRKGAEDERGAPLWIAMLNVINKTKPRIVTMENVKGLLNAKHKDLVLYYMDEMSKMGYHTEYKVLNAMFFGIPQNRERVFFVSRNDGKPIVWPTNNIVDTTISEIAAKDLTWDPIYPDMIKWECLNEKGDWVHSDKTTREVFKVKEPLKTMNVPLSKNYTQNLMASLLGQSPTLTTSDKYIYKLTGPGMDGILYRRLIPLEFWRLMGFSDGDFYKAKAVVSDAQLKKQAGNAIVVNVAMALLKGLLI